MDRALFSHLSDTSCCWSSDGQFSTGLDWTLAEPLLFSCTQELGHSCWWHLRRGIVSASMIYQEGVRAPWLQVQKQQEPCAAARCTLLGWSVSFDCTTVQAMNEQRKSQSKCTLLGLICCVPLLSLRFCEDARGRDEMRDTTCVSVQPAACTGSGGANARWNSAQCRKCICHSVACICMSHLQQLLYF